MVREAVPNMIEDQIAQELQVSSTQVEKAVALLDEGATVPFIARYRKEATGGLSDEQLRSLEKRLVYLRELNERKEAILRSIEQQGKLTEKLQADIQTVQTKNELEDLYVPFKPKRQSKALKAREAGLEALVAKLLDSPGEVPLTLAQSFLNPEAGIDSPEAALEGARHIFVDDCNNQPELVKKLREKMVTDALLYSSLSPNYKDKPQDKKVIHFSNYLDYHERLADVPSHRALAILRGRQQGVLQLKIDLPVETTQLHPCQFMIAEYMNSLETERCAENKKWFEECCRWAWRTRLHPRLESELLTKLRLHADEQSIEVFAKNLKHLLLAPPAGNRVTMGLDPGLRTGVKVAIVGQGGDVVFHGAIFPHEPQKQWDQALADLAKWVEQYQVQLIAIGNGTASRETNRLVGELIKSLSPKPTKVVVSEAGASIYSASELASQELPDLDVSFRGAVSIARRLQDPLAELVKIEPKSIGVGQYQHDVDQALLNQSLHNVVEDCVNAIGVDVNTASVPLLAQVSGVNSTLAGNIVRYREANGPFANRQALRNVPRFGDKTFELSAGFLRIVKGDQVLDASAVHPEAYSLVEQMAEQIQVDLQSLMGNSEKVKLIKAEQFVNEQFGLPTINDILLELEKPGRDPREAFQAAEFREDVNTLDDLKVGMMLEGVVTNVTHFGAFVDVGLYQEGLVHISELSDQFVKDPHTFIKAGEIVKVRVIEVDRDRDRVALSMKTESALRKDSAASGKKAAGGDNRKNPAMGSGGRKGKKGKRPQQSNHQKNGANKDPVPVNSLASAFSNARQLRQ